MWEIEGALVVFAVNARHSIIGDALNDMKANNNHYLKYFMNGKLTWNYFKRFKKEAFNTYSHVWCVICQMWSPILWIIAHVHDVSARLSIEVITVAPIKQSIS